jgi:hypothetical protein
MPARTLSLAEAITLGLFALLLILVAAMGWRAWKAARVSPEELERRRRKSLVAAGKMGDGNLVDIRDGLIFYSYAVRGVEYTASQDVTRLSEWLPADPGAVRGPLLVRYDVRNPANSIILDEEWSGIRSRE